MLVRSERHSLFYLSVIISWLCKLLFICHYLHILNVSICSSALNSSMKSLKYSCMMSLFISLLRALTKSLRVSPVVSLYGFSKMDLSLVIAYIYG